MIVKPIAASRCPRCQRMVVPAARHCPDHPVSMEPASVPGVGEIVSFTTLHSPPEGFKAPLHIAPDMTIVWNDVQKREAIPLLAPFDS